MGWKCQCNIRWSWYVHSTGYFQGSLLRGWKPNGSKFNWNTETDRTLSHSPLGMNKIYSNKTTVVSVIFQWLDVYHYDNVLVYTEFIHFYSSHAQFTHYYTQQLFIKGLFQSYIYCIHYKILRDLFLLFLPFCHFLSVWFIKFKFVSCKKMF